MEILLVILPYRNDRITSRIAMEILLKILSSDKVGLPVGFPEWVGLPVGFPWKSYSKSGNPTGFRGCVYIYLLLSFHLKLI